MARKKIESIKTLGEDVDKLTVQKSIPLFSLWRSKITLAEFKILDTYLARIDSHNPNKRVVVFEKGELEEKLGVKKINKADLEKRLKNLMGTVVKIEDASEKKGFRLVTLFEEAVVELDEQIGLWKVRMECTQKAMKYFFNVDNIGYLRYKLRNIIAITSRHSYIMFTYLEHNRFRKSWTVDVDELREILDCADVETYGEFKEFNKQVLKKACNELTEKTECKYTYEPVKKGRKVVKIRFTIETQADVICDEELPGQISMAELEELKYENELELWKTAIECFEFTDAQYDEIHSILVTVPEKKLPFPKDAMEIRQYHYLDQAAKEITRRDKELKPIRNKFLYLKRMIKKDSEE